MSNLRVGIVYNSHGHGWSLSAFARRVERAGLASIWVNENVHSGVPHLDPFVTLASIAAHTDRIQIGTAVALAPLRPPVELARTTASVDRLSGGRFVFGVGAGGGAPDGFSAYGVPLSQRGARTEEALEIVTRLWTGEPVTFRGQFYAVGQYGIGTTPRQVPGPPIWMGGGTPAVLERASRWADGFLPIRRSPQECGVLHQRVADLRERTERASEPIVRAVYLYLCMSDSTRSAVETAQREVETRYQRKVLPFQPGADSALGTPSECRALLEDYAAHGIEHVVVDLACPDAAKEEQLEALLGEVVANLAAG